MAYSYVPPPASAAAPVAAAAATSSSSSVSHTAATSFLPARAASLAAPPRHPRVALAHVPRRARPVAPCRVVPCAIASSADRPKELPSAPVHLQLPPARAAAADPASAAAARPRDGGGTLADALFSRIDPRLVLSLVPMLGAFMPIIIKLLFLLPRALSLPTFNSLRLIVSCSCFLPALLREARELRRADWGPSSRRDDDAPRHSPSLPSLAHARAGGLAASTSSSPRRKSWRTYIPGIELGLLIFLANIAQIIGLRYTSAGRAAFINQLSTVFVPLAAAGMGIHPLTGPVLFGALSCVAGIFALTADAPAAANAATSASLATATASSQWFGDALQFINAGLVTMYVLRIHTHTRSRVLKPDMLLALKVFIQTVLSFVWTFGAWAFSRRHAAGGAGVAGAAGAAASGVTTAVKAAAAAAVATPWTPLLVAANIALIVSGGLVVNAFTSWLQMRGQAQVPPGEAAVLFATQPIWTAIFAAFLLGERFTHKGLIGASLVVAGTMIASAPRPKKPA